METLDTEHSQASTDSKQTGILLRQAPYGKHLAYEALDVVLAYAAFDQNISLFFIGDGVFQLLKGQNSQAIEQKSLEKKLNALSLYDVNKRYVCQQSLEKRGLSADDLCIDITLVTSIKLSQHIRQQNTLISF